MSTAADRLHRFAQRHPDAARLARLASLAVRIDAPLLRALRRRLLPSTDAGIEADLWFSPLTESVSSQGFVLDPQVADLLRRDLAAESSGENREQRALTEAAQVVEAVHRDWPPSLQLEERAIWLALKDGDNSAELEALLRQAVKAMAADASRGLEIARWAQRALPRLPATARVTEAALLLALGAAERLGGRSVLPLERVDGPALQHAAWILPSTALSRRQTIGLRRLADGLEFAAEDGAPLTLSIPATTPPLLQVSWAEGSQRAVQVVNASPGQRLALPVSAVDITLRTVAGEEYSLASATVSETADVPNFSLDGSADLRSGVVGVEYHFTGQSGSGVYRWSGFLMAADLVVTRPPPEALKELNSFMLKSAQQPPVAWHIRHGGSLTPAKVQAIDDDVLLLSLRTPLANATVLPRAAKAPSINAGTQWQCAFATERGTYDLACRVTAPADGETYVLEATPVGLEDVEPDGLTGAPVWIDGEVVAMISGGAPPSNRIAQQAPGAPAVWRLKALPVARINDFIYRSLRPAEHDPLVYFCAAPTATPAEARGIDRLRAVLAAARVKPWSVDEDLKAGEDWAAQLALAFADCRGAAVVLSPKLLSSRTGLRELHMISYRTWAARDLAVAVFQSRTNEIRIPSGLPPMFETVLLQRFALDLDQASDAELTERVTQVFAGLQGLQDDASGQAAVEHELASLLTPAAAKTGRKRSAPRVAVDTAPLVRAIVDRGLFAEIDWAALLRPPVDSGAARRIVDIAAMFTVPVATARALREAVVQSRPEGPPAVSLNAMPITLGRALIARAWIGRTPPLSLAFRDQQWPELGSADDAPHVVEAEIQRKLAVGADMARSLLQNVRAPLFLVFATRPVPPRNYLLELKRALPHAVLLFLRGSQPSSELAVLGDLMVDLPPLHEGEDGGFMGQHKRLMELAAPRGASSETKLEPSTAPARRTKRTSKPPDTKAALLPKNSAPSVRRPAAKKAPAKKAAAKR